MKYLIPAVALGLLVSCGPKKEMTAQEVSEAFATMPQQTPGEWRSTIRVVSIDGPAVSAPERTVVGVDTVSSLCVPTNSARLDVSTLLNPRSYQDCKYYEASASDTHFSFHRECNTVVPGERLEVIVLRDSTPTTATETMTTILHVPGQNTPTTTKVEIATERTGACPAS